MERLHERHQRGGLRGAQALAVGRHVPSTLDNLPDELVRIEPDGHRIERRTPLPTAISERMTGVALLGLEHQGALTLERRAVRENARRDGLATPGIHLGAPWGMEPELGEGPEDPGEEHQHQHGDGTPPPALLSLTGNEWEHQEDDQSDGRADEEEGRIVGGGEEGEERVQPEEEEVRTGRGLDDRGIRLTARAA